MRTQCRDRRIDIVRFADRYPTIDEDSLAQLQTQAGIAEIKGIQRVITGHDTRSATPRQRESNGSQIFANPLTMTWNDLQEYADFNRDFLAAVRDAISAGKTADEAAATLRLPDRYKDYDMQQAKPNVQAIYAELKR